MPFQCERPLIQLTSSILDEQKADAIFSLRSSVAVQMPLEKSRDGFGAMTQVGFGSVLDAQKAKLLVPGKTIREVRRVSGLDRADCWPDLVPPGEWYTLRGKSAK